MAPTASAQSPSPSPPPSPVVVVSDPAVLRKLEGGGFDFGSTVAGAHAASTKELARNAGYRTLVDAMVADLAADRRSDASAGVGMRFAHRQFDVRWLDSDSTRFDLISVVNRVDRRPFARETCGEVRFVYRLSYRVRTKTGPVDSRLPMTVNVVYFLVPDAAGSCASVAARWLSPKLDDPDGETAWLVSDRGPLCAACRDSWKPKSVELNFQSVRWPSTVRPDMAGHAEYVLRVFRRLPAAPFYEPAPLENTIDAVRLGKDAALRAELSAWLRMPDTLRAVDEGTAVVPEKFLGKRAVSVTPHGFARRANRLYRAVFDPAAFRDVDMSRYTTIRSPAAFIRRLDALSCPGCHQNRSIAGFHLLGVEPESDRVDAVAVPMSPHFHGELARRRAYTLALAQGATPDDRRPPPERTPGDDGIGAHCGLGDPGFSEWTCASGLECVSLSDEEVGECVTAGARSVGDPCEHGPAVATPNAQRDRIRLGAPVACGSGRACEANSVGFPDGMCAGGCDSLPAGARCGGIPLLVEFNACLARGVSFERCIADNTRPGALRACGFHSSCRDDYVCARGAADAGDGGGVCMPPYFLFQLRVDGHPI
jgi:hypothetical protein